MSMIKCSLKCKTPCCQQLYHIQILSNYFDLDKKNLHVTAQFKKDYDFYCKNCEIVTSFTTFFFVDLKYIS